MVPLSPSMSAATMDQDSQKGMRTSRRRSRDSNYHKNGQQHGGTAIEMQSSSPDEGGRTRQATQKATQAVAAAGAVAAGAKKEEESLYDQLLRHHKENNLDDSSLSYSNSDTFDAFSVMSEEDRKLPAIPSQALHGRARKPISLPYSRNHVVIADPGADSGLSGATPSTDTAGTGDGRSRSTPEPRREEYTDKHEADVADVLYPKPEAVPRSHTGMNDEDRKTDFKKPREHSNFYMAALEAAGESDIPPILPPNDLEQDERLARHLSQLLEEPPPPSALDEELARVLQAAEPKPPEESEEDVVLALQLMEQEEKLHTAPSTGIAPTSTSALADKELAIRLSKEITLGGPNPNGDTLLAIELSRFEKSTARDADEMVPEQLQILERIQQDKERKQIEQAMIESSLHELPVFQETSDDVGVGFSFNGSNHITSEQDYQLSQELALNEWTSLQDRGAETRPGGGDVQASFRSAVSRGGMNRAGNGQVQRSQESNVARPQQQGESTFFNRVPGRAVSVDSGGRENPINPRGGQQMTRARSSLPGREERRRKPAALSSQSQHQDLVPLRPPDDLLRRGNQETRSAIATGRAHVVLCQGCDSRLHAPMNYSLVFCPTCNTISPGLTATNSANASLSSRRGGM